MGQVGWYYRTEGLLRRWRQRSIKSHSWVADRVSGVFSLWGLENYSSNTNCIFHLEPFLPLRLFSWKASRRRNSPIFKPSKTCFPYAFSNHVSKIKQILLRFMYLFSCFSTSSYEALDGSFYTPLGKHPSQMQERSSTLYIFMLSQVIIPTNFLPGLSKCLLAFSPWDTLLTILQGHTVSLRAFQTSLKAPPPHTEFPSASLSKPVPQDLGLCYSKLSLPGVTLGGGVLYCTHTALILGV